MRARSRIWMGWTLCLIVLWAVPTHAVRIIPNRFDLEQDAGSTQSYVLLLESDRDVTENLTLYVGDWERDPGGEHDWEIPVNGARWVFGRAFSPGEMFTIMYSVSSPDPAAVAEGTFRTGQPQYEGRIEDAPLLSSAPVRIVRDRSGTTVTLSVQVNASFEGLVIYEAYDREARLTSVDAAGGAFDAVARSSSAWISLSQDRVVLAPGERREILVTIDTPAVYTGSYWSAVFVAQEPMLLEQGGTTVLAMPRTAVKVFVTAPGTARLDGAVTAVEVVDTAPLILDAAFHNLGNVEAVVSGEVQIVDRTGTVVRDLYIDEFKVLPDATRVVEIADVQGAGPLETGIYQAVVRFEYGGDTPVVGVRGFRVR